MARVQLHPRPLYRFRCRIAVRTTDLNYGGHLANDRLLALVHEARVAFLASAGLTEIDGGGASLILADAAVVYQAEAFAGDELQIEAEAGEPTRAGLRFFFRLTRPADGAAIALVEQGLVCFDYAARRIRPLTPALRALCGEGQV